MRGLATILAVVLAVTLAHAQTPPIRPLPPTHVPPQTTAQYTYTARTQAAVRRTGEVVVLGVHWTCSDTTCTVTGPWPRPLMLGCVALVRQIGPITALGRPGAQFTPAQVAQCNASVGARSASSPPPSMLPVTTQELSVVGGNTSAGASIPSAAGRIVTMTGELSLVGGALGDSSTPPPPSLLEVTTSELSVVGQ